MNPAPAAASLPETPPTLTGFPYNVPAEVSAEAGEEIEHIIADGPPAWVREERDDPPAPDSPIFVYGDQAIINRAVLVLLRRMREIERWILREDDVIDAQAGLTEIDALLAEIAGWDGRRGESVAQKKREATQ